MGIKERMYEILNETIEYYDSPEKFGYDYDEDRCCYLTDEGKMCAVGRCLTEDARIDWVKQGYGSICCLQLNTGEFDTCFKEEYRGLPFGFWEKLQHAHDRSALDKYKYIKEKYITEVKDFINNYVEE